MSIQAVAWVLENSESRGFARLVLISLANHHNGGSGQCNPGQRMIASEAGVSTGSVPAQVAKLVEIGELVVEDPGGSHRSARYRLPFAESEKNAREVSEGNAQPGGSTRGPGLSAARGPGLSRTGKNQEPSRRAAVEDDEDRRRRAAERIMAENAEREEQQRREHETARRLSPAELRAVLRAGMPAQHAEAVAQARAAEVADLEAVGE